MPDLNLKKSVDFKYLIQNAIWWIESCDLDGFRVDTYNYSDQKELQLGPNLSPMNIPILIL
jgi:1,4-alpha-glucan branching enzyme